MSTINAFGIDEILRKHLTAYESTQIIAMASIKGGEAFACQFAGDMVRRNLTVPIHGC
ncbi:MAG: hypothetical protein M1533_02090 [Candidatus Thermoplasmatota archaeon]|nr:hypothetical protein [Candidatus Thermoplasmatota archaeon]